MHAALKLQCRWVTGNKKFTIGGLIMTFVYCAGVDLHLLVNNNTLTQ